MRFWLCDLCCLRRNSRTSWMPLSFNFLQERGTSFEMSNCLWRGITFRFFWYLVLNLWGAFGCFESSGQAVQDILARKWRSSWQQWRNPWNSWKTSWFLSNAERIMNLLNVSCIAYLNTRCSWHIMTRSPPQNKNKSKLKRIESKNEKNHTHLVGEC